jgi:hypothetical protein
MLNRLSVSDPNSSRNEQPESLDLSLVFGFARRNWPIVGLALVTILGLAIAFLVATPPLYLAKSVCFVREAAIRMTNGRYLRMSLRELRLHTCEATYKCSAYA